MKVGEYKYVENPDGTYTEYYRGTAETPVQGDTYSAEEIQESDTVLADAEIDSGTTGQAMSGVEGSNAATEHAAEDVVAGEPAVKEPIRTGEPYVSEGEKVIGNDLIGEDVAAGTLPDEAVVVAGAGGAVLSAGVGAGLVGVAIGTGIDELLGWPELGDLEGSSDAEEPYGGYATELYWEASFGPEVTLGTVKACEGKYGNEGAVVDLEPAEIFCEFPGMGWAAHSGYTLEKVEYKYGCTETGLKTSESGGRLDGYYFGYTVDPTCGSSEIPGKCATGVHDWVDCDAYLHEDHAEIQFWDSLSEVEYEGFPAKELEGYETSTPATAPHPEVMPPIPTPVKVPAPSTVPPPVRHKIIEKGKKKKTRKEKEEEEEGKHPVPPPLIEPLEPGHELPNPDWPEVPQPHKDEPAEEYNHEVEKEGFTKPEDYTLPEDDTDPETGPGDVAKPDISPEPGTKADPGTKVKVGVNPSDAPEPGESKGGYVGPTPPGIKLPKLEGLCRNFPFGVPCWMVEEVGEWVTAREAPDWDVPLEVPLVGYKDEIHLEFSHLEAAMEIIRPVIVSLSIMGLLALFYGFSRGGGGGAVDGDAGDQAQDGGP